MPARRKTHCRGGFHIRPGRSRRRGVARDDASIVPYRGLRHRRVRIFPVGRAPAVDRRGGIYPSRGLFAARRGCPGRCKHRPLQGFVISRRLWFPFGRGPAVVRRGGIYPSRGRSQRRRVCGKGMPLPYIPSGNDRPHGKAGCPPGGKPIVGADSISARGACGAAGLPGTMQASSPTGVCYNTEVVVSRLAAGPAVVRRGGIYPSRGRLRRRGVRRDEGIPPYRSFYRFRIYRESRVFPARDLREGHAPPLHAFRQRPATWEGRMPARRKTHCRGGFYIRPVRGAAGVARDDASIVPLQRFVITRRLRFPGWPRARRGS